MSRGDPTEYCDGGRWGDTGEFDDMPSWYLVLVLWIGISVVLAGDIRDSVRGLLASGRRPD